MPELNFGIIFVDLGRFFNHLSFRHDTRHAECLVHTMFVRKPRMFLNAHHASLQGFFST